MDSGSNAGTTDRLSTLPVELLKWIFELAYEGEETTTGPISRALLPFDRRERFSSIRPVHPKQLKPFAQLVKDSPRIRTYVRRFSLSDAEGSCKTPPLAREPLIKLVAALPLLEFLSLGPISMVLLDLDNASTSGQVLPPSLSHLCLLFAKAVESHDLRRYRFLDKYPSIKTLTVRVGFATYRQRGKGLVAKEPSGAAVPLQHIEHIFVRGDYESPNERIAPNINACPHLRSVEVVDFGETPNVPPFVEALKPGFTSLRLGVSTRCWEGTPACDHLLPRFPHLTFLHLGCDIYNASTLFANLRRLPSLSTLSFGLYALPPLQPLLDLIASAERHPAISRLVLDTATPGKRGWRIREDGGGQLHPGHVAWQKRVGPGWQTPDFGDAYEHFSTTGIEELVRVGKENGVEVSGTAVEGVELYHDWRAEATECLLVYGREQGGDHSELRAFLGQEEAQKVLRERGIKEGRDE